MDYQTFSNILNRSVFGEEREELLRKLLENPNRFVGLFRPFTPEVKVFQHIFQAREIAFGNALEEVIRTLLCEKGFIPQNLTLLPNLKCDHYFLYPDRNRALLIEQKVRDDHDSTKRQGQWDNFAEKVRLLNRRHQDALTAVFYFVDPSLRKNHSFYSEKISLLTNELRLTSIYLWYGKEMFSTLGFPEEWDKITNFLIEWKKSLPKLPSLNWEESDALSECCGIAQRNPTLWFKFAQERCLWEEGFVKVLFPTGKGLRDIIKVLTHMDSDKAQRAGASLTERLREFYESGPSGQVN